MKILCSPLSRGMIAAAIRLGQKRYEGDEARGFNARISDEIKEQLRQSWRDTIAAYRPPGEIYSLDELGKAFPRPESLGPGITNKLGNVLRKDPAGRFIVFAEAGSRDTCVRVRGNELSVVKGVEALEVNWRQRAAAMLARAAQDKPGMAFPLRQLEKLCPGPKQLPPSCRLRDVLEEDPEQRFAVVRSGTCVRLNAKAPLQGRQGRNLRKEKNDGWLLRMMGSGMDRDDGWASGTVDDEMRERIAMYLDVSSSRPPSHAGSAAPLAPAIPRVRTSRLSLHNQELIEGRTAKNLQRNLERKMRRNEIADHFYAYLDADRPLMQRCSDPIIFREVFITWKSQGNVGVGLAPSMLLTLWRQKRLILHRRENPHDVIVFKVLVARDRDGNRTMADILDEQRMLVAEGRRDIEADRGGISITELCLDVAEDGKEMVVHPGSKLERTLRISNSNSFDVLLT